MNQRAWRQPTPRHSCLFSFFARSSRRNETSNYGLRWGLRIDIFIEAKHCLPEVVWKGWTKLTLLHLHISRATTEDVENISRREARTKHIFRGDCKTRLVYNEQGGNATMIGRCTCNDVFASAEGANECRYFTFTDTL